MCEITPTMRLELPLDDASPRRARRFLRGAVCPVHAASVLDSAQLLVSELVTNGIRYGAPPQPHPLTQPRASARPIRPQVA
jgi:hypothetical protein